MKSLIFIAGCYLCFGLTDSNDDNTKGRSPNPHLKILIYDKDLTLQCDKIESGHTVRWLKKNAAVNTKNGHVVIQTSNDSSFLTIHWATDKDAGQYRCLELDENESVVSMTNFSVIAKPVVKLPHKKSVIENETLQLECDVIGTPPIVVEWTVGNKTYNESEDRILLTDSRKGIKNNFFILRSANLSDRGYITCTAYNGATDFEEPPNSVRVFIRVIDTNTPVRIFVWMCIVVIILLIMIFTYEKWRREPDSDCNDSHQNNDQ